MQAPDQKLSSKAALPLHATNSNAAAEFKNITESLKGSWQEALASEKGAVRQASIHHRLYVTPPQHMPLKDAERVRHQMLLSHVAKPL